MKKPVKVNSYLVGAPPASCVRYDAGDTIVCKASGTAKNSYPVSCCVDAIALETDGSHYRFPPDPSQDVCDWCLFTETGHRGCFLELKGSDFNHAVDQLKSTMSHMRTTYGVRPQRAIAVLSGAHPSNARPDKAIAKAKFKAQFPEVDLCERSRGNPNPQDVLT